MGHFNMVAALNGLILFLVGIGKTQDDYVGYWVLTFELLRKLKYQPCQILNNTWQQGLSTLKFEMITFHVTH